PSRSKEPGERKPRTTLSRRQTQGIVLGACAAVLLTVGILAIAGVFSSGSADSATTTPTTTTNAQTSSGRPQGYPLLPIIGASGPAKQAKLSSDGSFEDSIPIPSAVQSILPNVQAVAITLSKN